MSASCVVSFIHCMVEGCNAAQCGNRGTFRVRVGKALPKPLRLRSNNIPCRIPCLLLEQYHPERLPYNRKKRSVVVWNAPPLLLLVSTSDSSNLQNCKVTVTASHQLRSTYIDSRLRRKPPQDVHELRRKFLTQCKLGTRCCVFSMILMRLCHCPPALAVSPIFC